MNYPKVLTIQDISCVGQCSLTVALPILSACGIETCIMPSAVLSTHTAGFKNFTFRDLTDDMPAIMNHWVEEGIKFDGIYTGYLGSIKQIEYVKKIMKKTSKEKGLKIVDPAMADNGKLYSIFDDLFVEEMKSLVSKADVILPNITEACLLTDSEYKEEYNENYIKNLVSKLEKMGAKSIILTGVSFEAGRTGVFVYDNGKTNYYEHEKINRTCHGTGDVFASAFVGALMHGKSLIDAVKIAADFVLECIKITNEDIEHWYGVKFELVLPKLIEILWK